MAERLKARLSKSRMAEMPSRVRIPIPPPIFRIKVLEDLGMDMSSAIKIFFRQIINIKNFPCELRDANGFTLRNAEILRKSIAGARNNEKSFNKGSTLIKDALKD